MTIVSLKGTVVTGTGGGARFVSLPWVKSQMKEKLGFDPFPGTLNIMLNTASAKAKKSLEKAAGLDIVPEPHYCRGKLFKARMGRVECAVVIPKVRGYPELLLEVVAPSDLRTKLQLADGSLVEVKVTF